MLAAVVGGWLNEKKKKPQAADTLVIVNIIGLAALDMGF